MVIHVKGYGKMEENDQEGGGGTEREREREP